MFKHYLEYLKDNPQGYWFKRKLYGWGWTPATWQGWSAVLAYLGGAVTLALKARNLESDQEVRAEFLFPLIFLTLALIIIAYLKGEKPRWQWGLKDGDGEDQKAIKK